MGYGESFIFLALLFASILALAVGLERGLTFKKTLSKDADNFRRDLVKKLRKHDLSAAKELTDAAKDSAYSRFSSFAIDHYREGHAGLEDLMDGKMISEKLSLERRLSILGTLGNNAPFIGLLGTVLGVVQAFHGLGTLGDSGVDVVMRSISSALLATAAGLAVAIPVVMANNYFIRKTKIVLENLNILSKEFLASYSHTKSRKQG